MSEEKTPATTGPTTTGTATKQQPSMFSPRSLLIILGIALVLQVGMSFFWPKPAAPTGVTLTAKKASFSLNETVSIVVHNQTDAALSINSCSPRMLEKQDGSAWASVEPVAAPTTQGCTSLFAGGAMEIPAQSTETIKLTDWSDALKTTGRYRVTMTLPGITPPPSVEFDVKERNALSAFFLAILFQPILNALVWLITVLPGMSLGLAIICLTLLIRLVLFIPTYRSLSHQAELQALQPELQRIQKEYAKDKEKQAAETMKLYKDRGVNPCGSCLPILIQLPVLWAMYYVLASGLDPSNHTLLYGALQHVDFASVQVWFLGMNLLTPKASIVLPIVVGALQFLTMKLITWSMPKEAREAAKQGPAASMNMAMTYVMPFFIAWLTYTYPAGLGLYWGTSTLFGIGQQLVLKRAKERREEEKRAGASTITDAEFRDAPPTSPTPPAPPAASK